jgi:hypothetical protein
MDIVERLRLPTGGSPTWFFRAGRVVYQHDIERAEAASEIERLRERLALAEGVAEDAMFPVT